MDKKPDKNNPYRSIGLGISIPGILCACLLIGAGLGSLLDRWLSTGPWLLLLFLCFGFVAGIRETIKLIRRMGD